MEEKNEVLKNIDNEKLNIVDLIKYIANIYGCNLSESKKADSFSKYISPKNKTLFILVDGLGYYKVKSLFDSNILKKNLKTDINTVIPTSTSCVLTSIYTASMPSNHGILGWWSYNKSIDKNYYSLLLKDRKTDENLTKQNVDLSKILITDSIFDKFNCNVNIIMDEEIINTEYSKIFAGKNANRVGYIDIKHGFTHAYKCLNKSDKNFTYLYIDMVDSMSHECGVNSYEVNNVISEIEKGIKYILDKEIEDLNIILTADHGQIEMEEIIYLNKDEDFTKYFYAMPSIDTRFISFFVKRKYMEEFQTKFKLRFGQDIELFPTNYILENEVFGKNVESKYLNNSLGEYIGIVKTNKFLVCDKDTYEDYKLIIGNHSGLTNEEIKIPLVVI